MSHRAWIFIGTVLIVGFGLVGMAIPMPAPSTHQWLTFLVLTILATITQHLEVEAPGRNSYYPHLIFFFSGVLLLPPLLFIGLVTIPHISEWILHRLENNDHLKQWYIQPFNIATHIIAGAGARWMYLYLDPEQTLFLTLGSMLAVIMSAICYVMINHVIIGQVLVLARNVSWRESGVLEIENLLTDLVMLVVGYGIAALWSINPWLVLPGLSPLVLMYRALMVPQLKKDAQTDAKTGLANARHFSEMFEAELSRAKRFERPIAVLMADLDGLGAVNNTYGHLAGDAALINLSNVIQETVREYDIAGRFGGEEFAIVLPETSEIEARAVAERVRKAVEHSRFEVATSPTPLQTTVSIGVACYPDNGSTTTDLLHEADVAGYQAKLRGKNRVVCASEIPHSIKLEDATNGAYKDSAYQAAFAPRQQSTVDQDINISNEIENIETNGTQKTATDALPQVDSTYLVPSASENAAETPVSSHANITSRKEEKYSNSLINIFIGCVVALAVVVSFLGIALPDTQMDLIAIGLFGVATVAAQLFQIPMYGNSTISVAAAVIFATALVTGIPGVVFASVIVTVIHSLRRKPAIHKVLYNWATHTLAGAAPVLISLLGIPLTLEALPLLAIPTIVAALAYYTIDASLISTAIALTNQENILKTWKTQFGWLVSHYLVAGILGLFLAIAYTVLGPLGVIVFTLPVLLMSYAQKQYVDRTRDSVQELNRMNQELTQANSEITIASQEIRQLNEELFITLSKVIDARDPDVHGHVSQVGEYAVAIAKELGFSDEQLTSIRQGAFLHDIGKLGIPESILHKPSKLTDEEYEIIKTHVHIGANLLETSHSLRHLIPIVLYHHERWDGRGYPDGLRGESIPIEARILSICDTVEAMASDRPYKKAMPLDEIITELKRCSGTQFDPRLIKIFTRILEHRGEEFVINSAQSSPQPSVLQPNIYALSGT